MSNMSLIEAVGDEKYLHHTRTIWIYVYYNILMKIEKRLYHVMKI